MVEKAKERASTTEMDIARKLADEALEEGDITRLGEAYDRIEAAMTKLVSAFDVVIEFAAQRQEGDVSAVERVAMAAIALAEKVIHKEGVDRGE